MSGQVLGRAGYGVATGDWVANEGVARAGAEGEYRTGAILDAMARNGEVTVLHDLMIPLDRVRANIDHVVVTGRTVYIIDSKTWRAGFFWTAGSRTFRGMSRFASAEKKTMVMARQSLTAYLGSGVHFPRPMIAVWWSKPRAKGSTWAMKVPGAKVVQADTLARRIKDRGPADPVVIAALTNLLTVKPTPARLENQIPAAPPAEARLTALSVHFNGWG